MILLTRKGVTGETVITSIIQFYFIVRLVLLDTNSVVSLVKWNLRNKREPKCTDKGACYVWKV